MKIHFDPYAEDDEAPDKTICGVYVSDLGYETTTIWTNVTCLRCIKQRDKILKFVNNAEDLIIKQMGSFVDFCNEQEEKELI